MFKINEQCNKMNKNKKTTVKQIEKEILEQALERLGEILPEQPTLDYDYAFETEDAIPTPDIRIGETMFTTIIRTVINKADTILLMHVKLADNMLYVTRFVNTETADVLRRHGINFIDTVGNAYINVPPIYIWITGKQNPKTGEFRPKGLFNPAGLRLIFALLCFPGLGKKTYRTIAQTTGIALGAVGLYMNAMREEGYIFDNKAKGLLLMKKKDLFHRWIIEYPERLKPKLVLGRYDAPDNWLNEAKLDPIIAQWGGEVAAAKLTNYLKPQMANIYINREKLNDFLLENRLRKDPGGKIELVERFWKEPEDIIPMETVNPILVYADIMATGDRRNTETAKIIYEKNIAEYLRED
jgi:hypothetical protein